MLKIKENIVKIDNAYTCCCWHDGYQLNQLPNYIAAWCANYTHDMNQIIHIQRIEKYIADKGYFCSENLKFVLNKINVTHQ